MKNLLKFAPFLLLIIGFVLTILLSQDSERGKLSADIDKDGRLETVQWRKFTKSNVGDVINSIQEIITIRYHK